MMFLRFFLNYGENKGLKQIVFHIIVEYIRKIQKNIINNSDKKGLII